MSTGRFAASPARASATHRNTSSLQSSSTSRHATPVSDRTPSAPTRQFGTEFQVGSEPAARFDATETGLPYAPSTVTCEAQLSPKSGPNPVLCRKNLADGSLQYRPASPGLRNLHAAPAHPSQVTAADDPQPGYHPVGELQHQSVQLEPMTGSEQRAEGEMERVREQLQDLHAKLVEASSQRDASDARAARLSEQLRVSSDQAKENEMITTAVAMEVLSLTDKLKASEESALKLRVSSDQTKENEAITTAVAMEVLSLTEESAAGQQQLKLAMRATAEGKSCNELLQEEVVLLKGSLNEARDAQASCFSKEQAAEQEAGHHQGLRRHAELAREETENKHTVLQNLMKSREEQHEQSVSYLARATDKSEHLEHALHLSDSKLQTSEELAASLQTQLETAITAIVSAEAEQIKADLAHSKLQQELTDAAAKQSSTYSVLLTLESTIEQANRDIAAGHTLQLEAREQVLKLQNEMNKAADLKVQADAKQVTTDNTVASLKGQLTQARNTQTASDQQQANADSEIATLRLQLEQTREQQAASVTTHLLLMKQAAETQAASDTKQAQTEEKVASLQQQLKEAAEKQAASDTKQAQTEEMVASLQQQLTEAAEKQAASSVLRESTLAEVQAEKALIVEEKVQQATYLHDAQELIEMNGMQMEPKIYKCLVAAPGIGYRTHPRFDSKVPRGMDAAAQLNSRSKSKQFLTAGASD